MLKSFVLFYVSHISIPMKVQWEPEVKPDDFVALEIPQIAESLRNASGIGS